MLTKPTTTKTISVVAQIDEKNKTITYIEGGLSISKNPVSSVFFSSRSLENKNAGEEKIKQIKKVSENDLKHIFVNILKVDNSDEINMPNSDFYIPYNAKNGIHDFNDFMFLIRRTYTLIVEATGDSKFNKVSDCDFHISYINKQNAEVVITPNNYQQVVKDEHFNNLPSLPIFVKLKKTSELKNKNEKSSYLENFTEQVIPAEEFAKSSPIEDNKTEDNKNKTYKIN